MGALAAAAKQGGASVAETRWSSCYDNTFSSPNMPLPLIMLLSQMLVLLSLPLPQMLLLLPKSDVHRPAVKPLTNLSLHLSRSQNSGHTVTLVFAPPPSQQI